MAVQKKFLIFYNEVMRTRDQFRRVLWFTEQAKRKKYPNAKKLAAQFEISISQAQRDITEMRGLENKYWNIPLEYDYYEKGYRLSDGNFEMIGLWTSEEELLLFSLAKELLKDKDSKHILNNLLNKISASSNISPEKLKRGFRDHLFYKISGTYRIKDGVLQSILMGIINGNRVKFTYSPVFGDNDPFQLDVFPLLILFYKGNWYLLAKYKDFTRTYSLSRITDVKQTNVYEDYPELKKELRERIKKPYGIFINDFEENVVEVKLLFNKRFEKYISVYIIHPEQKLKHNDDGSVEVSFPSFISPELIGEILKFGSDVKVIAPRELQNEIKNTLKKIIALY